jgi:hypothetical protein
VSSKLHLHLTLNFSAKKILFTTDGSGVSLNGFCMYFLRTSTKRTLGEETFQVQQLTKTKLKEETSGYSGKKVNDFLVPSWDVTNQTLPGRE